MQMHIQTLQATNQQIDSDSSDNSDDNLDEFMKNKLKQQNKNIQNKSISLGFKVCIGIYLAFVLALLFLYLNSSFSSGNINQDNSRSDSQKQAQMEKELERNISNLVLPPNVVQKQLEKVHQISERKESVPRLQHFSYSVQLQDAFFSAKPLSTQSNPQRATQHWLVKQRPSCIPDQIVNSATRLSNSTFAQATAYSDVNIISEKVSIPAENLYYYQAARQFMNNMHNLEQNLTVVYDHYSPLLLILIIRHFQQGMFVSDRNNWPLLQKNLVFNDVYPLVTVYPFEMLVNSEAYRLLITHDVSLAIELIVRKKREVIVLVDLTEPISVHTADWLKMKVYRLQEGEQCQDRLMTLLQQANWHIEEKIFIVQGWYILTYPNNDISFGTQHYNYEQPLIIEEMLECRPLDTSQLRHAYFLANNVSILELPYSYLFWFGKETEKPGEYYQSINSYLNKKIPKSLVYLDSGPVVFLLVAVASLPSAVKIILNNQYSDKKMLMKMLVLNSQQKVQIMTKPEEKGQRYDLTLTSNHETLFKINSTAYILLNEKDIKINPSFRYFQIIEQGCRFPELNEVTNDVIGNGIYLIEASQ